MGHDDEFRSGPQASGVPGIGLLSRDIGRWPQLTHGEHVALAKRIEAGDSDARRTMISSNIRLVVRVAHSVERHLPLEDRVADGMVGLITAVDKYNWRTGYRFSTYATWWIRQAIQRGAYHGGYLVHWPLEMSDLDASVESTRWRLAQELRRLPSDVEVAAAVGTPVEKMVALRSAPRRLVSIDAPVVSAGGTVTVEDTVADMAAVVEREADEDRMAVEDALRRLDPELREVVVALFGFDGSGGRSVSDTGRLLGQSDRVVRRQRDRALAELRRLLGLDTAA
jgi:RNA polymerase primary sigma factor